MISLAFNTLLYQPFYNGLIFLISLIPAGDVGVVVILFTLLVKIALFPVSYRSIKTQVKMRKLEPEIRRIKEQYKHDKQQQATRLMALYKEKQLNPFSGFFLLFVQIPVILALYFLFLKGGLPDINTDLLYSFVPVPDNINMHFLGLVDISQKNVILAVFAGISQFFQARIMMNSPTRKKPQNSSLRDDLARSMQMQMKYVLPIFIGFVAYNLSAAVALYWTTSNLFAIAQEWYMRKNVKNEDSTQEEQAGSDRKTAET
jgi:YidC/Oxa1 family membrane protein insertase